LKTLTSPKMGIAANLETDSGIQAEMTEHEENLEGREGDGEAATYVADMLTRSY
jgi:hypothetical protein